MTNTNTMTLTLAALALAGVSASAATVYENSTGFQNAFSQQGNREIGDQITINDAAQNIVTSFEFEYNFVRGSGDGAATGQIRFYGMREISPGVVVPESEAFAVSPIFNLAEGPGRRIWSDIAVTVPTTFTYSVTFGGLDGTESAGLLFYNQPGTLGGGPGQSYDDFWQRDATWDTWSLFDTPGVIDNFGVRVIAVPEPSSIALISAAAALVALRRRKA